MRGRLRIKRVSGIHLLLLVKFLRLSNQRDAHYEIHKPILDIGHENGIHLAELTKQNTIFVSPRTTCTCRVGKLSSSNLLVSFLDPVYNLTTKHVFKVDRSHRSHDSIKITKGIKFESTRNNIKSGNISIFHRMSEKFHGSSSLDVSENR